MRLIIYNFIFVSLATVAFGDLPTHLPLLEFQRQHIDQNRESGRENLPSSFLNVAVEVYGRAGCQDTGRAINIHAILSDLAEIQSIRLIAPTGYTVLDSATHPEHWSVGTIPSAIYVMGRSQIGQNLALGTYTVEVLTKNGKNFVNQVGVTSEDLVKATPFIQVPSCGQTVAAGILRARWENLGDTVNFKDRNQSIFMSASSGAYHFDASGKMTEFVFQAAPGPVSFGLLYEFWRKGGPDRFMVFSSSERAIDFKVVK